MNRCCICKSKNTDDKNKYFLFTDKTGNKRIICNICKKNIDNIEKDLSRSQANESISYFRHLCDTKKLTDPEVINYLNENVFAFEEVKLTAGKTDIYDIMVIAVKVVKLVITAGLAAAGLILGISVALAMSAQTGIGIIMAAGIIIGFGIIAFTVYTVLKLFEDWIFYRGIVKR